MSIVRRSLWGGAITGAILVGLYFMAAFVAADIAWMRNLWLWEKMERVMIINVIVCAAVAGAGLACALPTRDARSPDR